MNTKIIKDLEELNEARYIKVDNSDTERTIFKSDRTFKIFGNESDEILNPFNDYSYSWLNGFLDNVISFIKSNGTDNLRDEIQDIMPEWIDSETDIYTHDLTKWVRNTPNPSQLIDETAQEGHTENLIQIAQYKAIEELYQNALNVLIDYLETEHDLEEE